MKRITMLLGAGILVLCSMVYAAVPQLINFQGVLKDGSGNPVADGAYSVQFTIYDAPAGGNVKWTETQSVTTVNGLFSVLLGAVTSVPDSAFNDTTRYLGITVSPDPEMAPRQQIVSTAYSFRVAHFVPDFSTNNTFIGRNAGNLTMSGSNNTASGYRALFSNTTGGNNTASGASALSSNTTGIQNTASGANALLNNTTGGGNTANGYHALFNNTAGNNNTASGARALEDNTDGGANTAGGSNALTNNTTGNFNTASGNNALLSNTTGSNNTALGYQADVSAGNLTNATAIGNGAIVNASNKIRLGNSAVTLVETDGNIKVGANDTIFTSNLSSNSPLSLQAPAGTVRMFINDANGNAGIGTTSPAKKLDVVGSIKTSDTLFASNVSSNSPLSLQAPAGMVRMFINDANGRVGIGTTTPSARLDVDGGNIELDPSSSTTGNITKGGIRFIHNFGFSNTFIGENAGNLTMTGFYNTASGALALLSNTTGFSNTASGAGALQTNTSGENNTACGVNALRFNTTGFQNTASGVGALDANTTGSNNTAIGFRANVSAESLTNATAIGAFATVNASNKIRLGHASVTVIEGQVAYTFPSDKNEKENFRPVDGAEVLKKIRGLELTSWNYKGHDPKQFRHYGPMAQDFFAAFGNDGVGKIGTETTLNSGDVAGILMIAVQALGNENADLKERVEQLEEMLKEMQAEKPQAGVRIE